MIFVTNDGSAGMKQGSCPNRAESPSMNTMSRSLEQMNNFCDAPDFVSSCKENSAPLENLMDTCYNVSANRWPNFIAVDFYKVHSITKTSHDYRKPVFDDLKIVFSTQNRWWRSCGGYGCSEWTFG